ncbi:MAG: C40 family peptidase [Paludibacter sp.]|nr:C40 family peptidase [Paludibacter sp.]
MYGLVTLPVVPLRALDSERSEMISQLLFGEFVEILEQSEKWFFIKNTADDYQGWVDRKMIKQVSGKEFAASDKSEKLRLSRPYSIIYNAINNQTKLLPGGSIVYELKGDDFQIGSENWSLIDPVYVPELPYSAHQIIEVAFQYINAPYLWGGKTILGIDCSGLVQLAFAIGGYSLPRDASQQVAKGKTVDFLSEVLPGDLAFFENAEGCISHVGILIDNSKIIHASGWVKVESVDAQGIISSVTGEYTHQLRVIKRVI